MHDAKFKVYDGGAKLLLAPNPSSPPSADPVYEARAGETDFLTRKRTQGY
jgi:hypothetical protein